MKYGRSGARKPIARKFFAGWCGVNHYVDAPVPTGGMFLWGHAPVDTRPALARAIAAGVAYVPGDAFTIASDGSRALRLSFATLDEPALRTAAARLRTVLAA